MTKHSKSRLLQALTFLARSDEEPYRQRRATQITTLVATALFMEMAQSFGTDLIGLNIGVTAYTLTLAVFIPISGWMADRFGARHVFAAAIATSPVPQCCAGSAKGNGALPPAGSCKAPAP